jgi:hypothetical protein
MKTIAGYQHAVASHCETGSLRNLLHHAGLDVSEPMIFGTGSGPTFYYLFFAKGPSTFPLVGIRNMPGHIVRNVAARCGISIHQKQYRTTEAAFREANLLIDVGRPVAVSVDMYYMKYLPFFLRVHAPFHFVVLIGREGGTYAVSDPYSEPIGMLESEDLDAAWATGAPLSRDNFLAYVKSVPREIDWRSAALKAIRETCRNMVFPPVVRNVLFFAGIQGMRTYARTVAAWGRKYRGHVLREGILFNAVGFEDQGTGGAAFRLMYGSFLEELAEKFGWSELGELGDEMMLHGQEWQKFSRSLVKIGKKVPMKDEEYDDWRSSHGRDLDEGLKQASELFLERARFEEAFFPRLLKAVSRLRP